MEKQSRSGLQIGGIYFIIHLLVEITSFATLYKFFGKPGIALMVAFMYDAFAFATQGLFGELMNRYKKIDYGTVGNLLMAAGVLLINRTGSAYGIIIVALGNAVLHECGAVFTVEKSAGKLFPSALFVGGGSFGVIIGQIIGMKNVSLWAILTVIIATEIFVIAGNIFVKRTPKIMRKYDIVKETSSFWLICAVAFFITAVRSYMGYSIPISWRKEIWQGILLFFMMGFGKIFGGYACDRWGARKTGIVTSLACIPFLIFGENLMVVSIIGIFIFSMTMPITFGMFLCVVKDNPGLAFGGTTLGLFAGTLPVFLGWNTSPAVNCVMVILLSIACAFGFAKTLW